MSSSKRSLLQMPEVVMKRILEECNYRSIYTLRKVCHTLRDSIDDIKPGPNPSYISISSESDAVRVELFFEISQEDIDIKYEPQENGCLVQWYDEDLNECLKVLEDRNYMEAALTDIKTILSHQKSKINDLILHFEPECKLQPKDFSFFEIFKNISNSSKSLFQVHTLFAIFLTEDQMMQILPYLNHETLKKLKISSDGTIRIEQFEKLEHWKHLEEFQTEFVAVPEEEIHMLLRIPRVRIETETLTKVGIEVLKEAFTTSLTTPESFELRCSSRHVIINLTKAFGEPVIVETIVPRRLARWIDPITYTRWFYLIPGSDDVAFICHAHSTIRFCRIKASEVAGLSVAHRIGREEDQDTDDDEN